jgi:hypothetical protein
MVIKGKILDLISLSLLKMTRALPYSSLVTPKFSWQGIDSPDWRFCKTFLA